MAANACIHWATFTARIPPGTPNARIPPGTLKVLRQYLNHIFIPGFLGKQRVLDATDSYWPRSVSMLRLYHGSRLRSQPTSVWSPPPPLRYWQGYLLCWRWLNPSVGWFMGQRRRRCPSNQPTLSRTCEDDCKRQIFVPKEQITKRNRSFRWGWHVDKRCTVSTEPAQYMYLFPGTKLSINIIIRRFGLGFLRPRDDFLHSRCVCPVNDFLCSAAGTCLWSWWWKRPRKLERTGVFSKSDSFCVF